MVQMPTADFLAGSQAPAWNSYDGLADQKNAPRTDPREKKKKKLLMKEVHFDYYFLGSIHRLLHRHTLIHNLERFNNSLDGPALHYKTCL